MQLGLFSEEEEQTGLGTQQLEQLKFSASIKTLTYVVEKYPENRAANRALPVAEYWNSVFETLRSSGSDDQIRLLNKQLNEYDFPDSGYLQTLKKSLQIHLADLMSNEGIYRNDNGTDICELYTSAGKKQLAEEAVVNQLDETPEDYSLILQLADLQFANNRSDHAKNNYFKVLLHNPQLIIEHNIEYTALKNVCDKQGVRRALAAAVFFKLVPFKTGLNDLTFENEDLQHALSLYRSVYNAEKVRIHGNDQDEVIKTRKELQSLDPKFFELYMSGIKMDIKR